MTGNVFLSLGCGKKKQKKKGFENRVTGAYTMKFLVFILKSREQPCTVIWVMLIEKKHQSLVFALK